MTVYLVDEPFVDVAISYAAGDAEARIVLLQDAVYASPRVSAPGQIYVIEDDVARRGMRPKIPQAARIIGYDELIGMMEREKVLNFL